MEIEGIMSIFWKAKVPALRAAIDATGTSRSQICSAGGLSTETLKRALDGERVIDAKANGIIKGLKAHGVSDAKKETIFVPV